MAVTLMFVLCTCWVVAIARSLSETLPEGLTKTPAKVQWRRGRADEDEFELQVEVFGTQQTFHLEVTNSILSDDFRLQVLEHHEEGGFLLVEGVYEHEEKATFYHDLQQEAVVRVLGDNIEGVLTHNLSLTTDAHGNYVAVQHVRPPASSQALDDFLILPPEMQTAPVPAEEVDRAVLASSPEVFVIVDSTLAKILGSDSKIKDYLGVFWNAVNRRFDTIQDPKVALQLVGALIVRNESDEPYVTNNLIGGKNEYILGANVIVNLSDWVFIHQDQFPIYDVAYLMTGRNMLNVTSTGRLDYSLSGISWTAGACIVDEVGKRSYKTSIGEDIGGYYTGVLTAAHELAHVLGAPHDGVSNSIACPWAQGFIMSYVEGTANKLLFSYCSAIAMKEFMNSASARCLLQKSAPMTLLPLNVTLPGQLQSMNTQCQQATGVKNSYAATTSSDDSLCVLLKCQWQVRNRTSLVTFSLTTGLPAAEGTPCRTKGKCTNGKCQ